MLAGSHYAVTSTEAVPIIPFNCELFAVTISVRLFLSPTRETGRGVIVKLIVLDPLAGILLRKRK